MENKKKIILGSIIGVFIGLLLGTTYAIFSYTRTGGNNQLIAGDIYMHYKESNTLTIENALPSNTYDPAKYFEFTIEGKNTNTKYNIVYDINLNYGDNIDNKIRIQDRFLKFRLVEVVNNEEQELLTDKTYLSIDNKRIYVGTINKNQTTEITKTYRLYMWIDKSVVIGNTDYADYSITDWNNVYGSVKVSVTGDFSEKSIQTEPYLVMKNLALVNDSNWANIFRNISSIEFSTSSEIPANAITSFDATDVTSAGPVTVYTLDDGMGNNTYKAIICGDGVIYAPENSRALFYGMTNLVTLNSKNFRVDSATNMQQMFQNCTNLTDVSSLTNWNVKSVTTMQQMFANCASLTNLSAANWDVSNVTNMQNMFYNCTNLINISATNWDVSNVINMNQMFYNCTNLTDISSLSAWNTSNVTSMYSMFQNCSKLSDVSGLANWNVSNVSLMVSTFQDCTNLTDISGLSIWNTSNVTNMSSMFKNCANLINVNGLANWNVGSVTNIQELFNGCTNLSDISGLSAWNTSNVIYMSNIFHNCVNLTNVGALSNWNTSNVTTMSGMFQQCANLIDISSLANWNTGKVTNMSAMFGMEANTYKIGNPVIDFSPLANWDVSNVTNMPSMFNNVNILSYQAFANWNVSKVQNFSHIFDQTSASTVTTLAGLENWNVSNATNMDGMFYENVSLADASAINNWNINSDIDFTRMFYYVQVHPTFSKVAGTWDSYGTFTPNA